jgi:hypothetical protein
MRFEENKLYKNLYTSPDTAFMVNKIIRQDKNGCDMEVSWYKKTDNGRYITIGVDGDYYIAREQKFHYVEVE